jgi:hypothetical protein
MHPRCSRSELSAQRDSAGVAALRKGLADEASPLLQHHPIPVNTVREVELIEAGWP